MKIKRQIRREFCKEKRAEWRISQSNTPRGWKKVVKIAGIVAGVGGALLITIGTGGLALPAVAVTALSLVTTAATSIASTAVFTKEDNPKSG